MADAPGTDRGRARARLVVAVCLALSSTAIGAVSTEDFEIRGEEQLRRSTSYLYYAKPAYYFLLLPGPVFYATMLFIRKKFGRRGTTLMMLFAMGILLGATGPFPSASVEAAVEAYDRGRYQDALRSFEEAQKSLPGNSSLAYNLALCRFRLGQFGHSLYNLRRCLRLDPRDGQARTFLDRLEQDLDLGVQVATGIAVHPNLAFLFAVAFFNIAFLILGLVGRQGRGGWFIMLVFIGLLSLGGFGALVYGAVQRNRPVAVVVTSQGSLKKIPLDQAQPWVILAEGTSLQIKGKAQNHVLVRTGLGLTGWIRSDEVRY